MTQGFSVVEQSPAYSQKPEPPDSNVTVPSTEQPTRNAVTAEIFCESVFNTQPALFPTQLQGEKCLGESCSRPGWEKRSSTLCPFLTLPAGEGNQVWFELLPLNTFAGAYVPRKLKGVVMLETCSSLTLFLTGFQALACVCSPDH